MWYAIAPDLAVQVPAPVPVERVILPPAWAASEMHSRTSPTESSGAFPWAPEGYTRWSPAERAKRHEQPRPPVVAQHHFPAIFYRNVTLPVKYETSERGAIRYICRELHVRFRFAGPDYALYGAGIPFNRKLPAITLLRDLANVSYIVKHSFTLQSRQVAVRNIWLPGMAG